MYPWPEADGDSLWLARHALRDAPKSPVLPAKSIWYAEDLGKDVIVSERDTYTFVIHCGIMQNVKLVSTV